MPIGVALVALWFVAVMLHLGWQFATSALARPVHGRAMVDAACEEEFPAGVAMSGPAGTVSGAGIVR